MRANQAHFSLAEAFNTSNARVAPEIGTNLSPKTAHIISFSLIFDKEEDNCLRKSAMLQRGSNCSRYFYDLVLSDFFGGTGHTFAASRFYRTILSREERRGER